MYMPTLARFTARDPMPPDGEPMLLGASRYGYVRNNPLNFVDPSGLSPEEQCGNAPDCTGGCIAGKDAQIKDITIDKMERQTGSDFACRAVTQALLKSTLRKLVEAANKKHGKDAWEIDRCSDKCKCDEYKLPDKSKDIELKDQIIDVTESGVHCIFKVTGKISMSGGALALIGCVTAKKE